MLPATLEWSVPHHNSPMQKQIHNPSTSTFLRSETHRLQLQNISHFNYKVIIMPRAQTLLEILLQTSDLLVPTCILSLLSKTSTIKQTYPVYQAQWKDLVTGKTCSTTAPTYSPDSSSTLQNYLTYTYVSLLSQKKKPLRCLPSLINSMDRSKVL
jgi:hypothetical protein